MHPPLELERLLWAMETHGLSGFWVQLVADQGPRGEAIGRRLWATMPKKYRDPVIP